MKIATPLAFAKALQSAWHGWHSAKLATVEWYTAPSIGPFPSVEAWVQSGERFDIVFRPIALLRKYEVAPQGLHWQIGEAFQAPVGVARRAGTQMLDVSSLARLRDVLLAASVVVYTTGASGKHFEQVVMPYLGIERAIAERLRQVGSADAAETIRNSTGAVGIQLLCELADQPGIQLVGALPSEIHHHVEVGWALDTHTQNSSLASDFLEFLRSDAARKFLEPVGLYQVG